MEEKRHKRLYPVALGGAALLLLAGLLTLVAGEFVRERLIQPLLFSFQVLGIYLRAIPQLGIWLFVLLLFLFASTYFLRARQPQHPKEARKRAEGTQPRPGLITDLARRIELGRQGEYFRWRLRRELRDFLVELLAWREELPEEEALEAVRSGEWGADPWVREFFQRGFEHQSTLFGRLQQFFSSLWRRPDEPFEQELAAIVDYLEGFASGSPNRARARKALAGRGRRRWS